MRKQTVKDRLIDTATRLFYQQGYNNTGINQILEESGVAKASMYQHFKAKEDLGLLFLQRMNDTMKTDLSVFINSRTAPREQLLSLFDFVLSFFQTKDFRGCWSLNTLAEIPKDATMLREEILKQKFETRELILQLVKDAKVSETPEHLANQLYLLYEAALVESELFKEAWPIEEAKQAAERLIDA